MINQLNKNFNLIINLISEVDSNYLFLCYLKQNGQAKNNDSQLVR